MVKLGQRIEIPRRRQPRFHPDFVASRPRGRRETADVMASWTRGSGGEAAAFARRSAVTASARFRGEQPAAAGLGWQDAADAQERKHGGTEEHSELHRFYSGMASR